MSRGLKKGDIEFKRTFLSDRETLCDSVTNFISTSSCKVNATRSDQGPTTRVELRTRNSNITSITTRVEMVDKQHNFIIGLPGQTGQSGNDNLLRCLIPHGMGSISRGRNLNRGSLDSGGEKETYKRVRTFGR